MVALADVRLWNAATLEQVLTNLATARDAITELDYQLAEARNPPGWSGAATEAAAREHDRLAERLRRYVAAASSVRRGEAQLAARPTSETILDRYNEMQQRIRDTLDNELGPFQWSVFRGSTESTCGAEFSGIGGRNVYMASWGFESNIADDQWPRARPIFADIAAEYGFAPAGLQIDEPGRHSTNGVDEALGAQYSFGTNVNTTMQITTGCHLPARPAGPY